MRRLLTGSRSASLVLTVSLGRVCTILDDDVDWVLRLAAQVVLKNLLDTVRIASLGIQRRTRDMRRHCITCLGSRPVGGAMVG